MGKPHSVKDIRERRERILLLMARGYNQRDIAKELGTTRSTIHRDMKVINELTNKGLFDMAKVTFATMYYNCVDGLDAILRECWKIHDNLENNPRIAMWHKIAALRLAAEIYDKKFTMFQNGPATMQLRRLHDRVDELRRLALEDNSDDDTFTKRSPYSPIRDFDIRDLDKP